MQEILFGLETLLLFGFLVVLLLLIFIVLLQFGSLFSFVCFSVPAIKLMAYITNGLNNKSMDQPIGQQSSQSCVCVFCCFGDHQELQESVALDVIHYTI